MEAIGRVAQAPGVGDDGIARRAWLGRVCFNAAAAGATAMKRANNDDH
jgi:hypothetical protein